MTFTIQTIAKSLADYLAPFLPGVTFYEDPNQQDSETPCIFLQQRYAHTKLHLRRWERRIGLDLTYLEDCNLTDLQQRYERTAEALDACMEIFPYSNSGEAALLRTYDREWSIDLDALHYKFELRIWNMTPENSDRMRHMDYHEEVRDA